MQPKSKQRPRNSRVRLWHTSVRAGLVLIVCALVFSSDVLAAAAVKTQLLLARDVATIQSKIEAVAVPGRTGKFHIEKSQSFAVSGAGFESFSLVPVHFEVVNVDGYTVPQPRCGAFIISKSAQPQFIPYAWSSVVHCDRLDGVGFAQSNPTLPPRVLLLYTASAPPDISLRQPVVLDWNPAAAHYTVNESLSQRLQDDAKVTSVPSMKRQLQTY